MFYSYSAGKGGESVLALLSNHSIEPASLFHFEQDSVQFLFVAVNASASFLFELIFLLISLHLLVDCQHLIPRGKCHRIALE